jgi:arabinogalactan oligomer/maltooligosaccharide transport system substrate-binding protein
MFSMNKKGAAALAVLTVVLGGVALTPAHAADKTLTIWADETRGPHLLELFGAVADQDAGDFVDGYVIDVKTQTSFDALKTALDNATAASGPDIVLGPNDWVPTGAKNGKLAAFTLPSSIKADFTANQLGDLSYKGKLYGVPLDVNNVAMVRNVGVPAQTTFGGMVDYYMNNKDADGLKAGLCILGGGTSWGGMSVYSALGMQPYRMKNGKVDTALSKPGKAAASGDPISPAFVQNMKTYLLTADGSNWKSNGFYAPWDAAATVAGFNCEADFKAGKVPFAILGNWQKDLVPAVNGTISPVPGITAGTYGNAFGSVSGALLTSFANGKGNLAAAKSLLNYFGSRAGQRDYQKIENRPHANAKAAKFGSVFQKGMARSAGLASIPQIGSILNGTGGNSWWDLAGNYFYRVAMNGEDITTTTNNLNTLLKANVVAGANF